MAKDRTGLQSKISQIFAGVPVPKKDRSRPKPRSSKPEPDSDDLSQPTAPEQTIPQPTATEPSAPEPAAQELMAPEQAAPESKSPEQIVAEPAITEPEVTEPVSPEQIVAEPAIIEPEVTEPVAPEPEVAQPATTESMAAEPMSFQPQAIEEPELKQPVEMLHEESSAKVLEAKVPERVVSRIPGKVSRRRKEKPIGLKAAARPKRQRTALILVVVLSIVLVLVLVQPFGTTRRSINRSRVAGRTKIVTPIENKFDFNIDWPVPTVYPAELRDPMEMASQQAKTETIEIVVRGISYSEDRRYAVIGTQTVQEGDEIFGATIVRINQSSVEFEKDGKRWAQEVEGEEK